MLTQDVYQWKSNWVLRSTLWCRSFTLLWWSASIFPVNLRHPFRRLFPGGEPLHSLSSGSGRRMRNAPVESSGECIFHPAVAADEWSGERKRVRLIPQLLTRPLGIKNSFSAPQKENAPGQKQYLESFARHFSFSLSLGVCRKKTGGYYFMRAGRNFSFHVLRLFARAPTFPLGCCWCWSVFSQKEQPATRILGRRERQKTALAACTRPFWRPRQLLTRSSGAPNNAKSGHPVWHGTRRAGRIGQCCFFGWNKFSRTVVHYFRNFGPKYMIFFNICLKNLEE